jgi:hypothetical protein
MVKYNLRALVVSCLAFQMESDLKAPNVSQQEGHTVRRLLETFLNSFDILHLLDLEIPWSSDFSSKSS